MKPTKLKWRTTNDKSSHLDSINGGAPQMVAAFRKSVEREREREIERDLMKKVKKR